jgi:type II secretory pathway pseudopilin PulG
MKARRAEAFSLLELLVVIGLISVLSLFLAIGLTGSGKAVALQSAQATLSNLVTAARTKAIATGKTTRLLINDNPANTDAYRRRLVLVEQNGSGWTVLHAVLLPQEVYLLPRKTHVLTGAFSNLADWKIKNGDMLGSTCLDTDWLPFAYETDANENWEYLGFTSRGTVSSQGSLILARGRVLPPTQVIRGTSPVEMTDPRNVRGMQISSYGVPRLVNGRTDFDG